MLGQDAKALTDLVRPARMILKSRPERLARSVGVTGQQSSRQGYLSRIGADGEPRCLPLPRGLKRSDATEILALDAEQLLARGLEIATVLGYMRWRAGTSFHGLKLVSGPTEDAEDHDFAAKLGKSDPEAIVREACRRCGMAAAAAHDLFSYRVKQAKR